ncbi:MAG: hypothetical protein ACXWWL_07145 [Candidatus Limnocylindria bacterium]
MEAPGSRGFPWLVAIVGVLLVLVLIAGAVAVVGLPQLGPQPTPAPAAPSGNSVLMRPWVG